MITTLDCETTFVVEDNKKTNPMPWVGNQLVSVGYHAEFPAGATDEYLCFYHIEEPPTDGATASLKTTLSHTTLLICHNVKFDLTWLRECGFVYDGCTYDTMLAEYVIARSRKKSFKLGDCLRRRGLSPKRSDLTQEYLADGVGFDKMPWSVVEEYGRADVASTLELAQAQLEELGMEFEDFIT